MERPKSASLMRQKAKNPEEAGCRRPSFRIDEEEATTLKIPHIIPIIRLSKILLVITFILRPYYDIYLNISKVLFPTPPPSDEYFK